MGISIKIITNIILSIAPTLHLPLILNHRQYLRLHIKPQYLTFLDSNNIVSVLNAKLNSKVNI